MGLVQTGIRSKLGVEKVRKTTVVGMDIKRGHIEAGLLRPRQKRHFAAPTNGELDIALDNEDNAADDNNMAFDAIAAALIADATADSDEDLPLPIVPVPPPLLATICLPAQAIRNALPPLPTPPATQRVPKTSIPLRDLFIFPGDNNAPDAGHGIDSFWQGGIKNLNLEIEALEVLSAEDEPDANSDGNGDDDVLMADSSTVSGTV